MNDDLGDRRLGRAVRSSLGDIVAAAPSSADPPRRGSELSPPSGRRRPMITLAAGLTAAAGILGVLMLANRHDGSPTESEATTPGAATTELVAAASGSTEAASATTVPAPAVPLVATAVDRAGRHGLRLGHRSLRRHRRADDPR